MDSFKVDGWNNFCRVFLLPEDYPHDFCFGGGHAVNFQMVDWFCPVPDIPQPAVTKEEWIKKVGEIKTVNKTLAEIEELLIPWLQGKQYIKPERKYLVLYDFGAASVFEGK